MIHKEKHKNKQKQKNPCKMIVVIEVTGVVL